jgi:hypothetical protein
MAGGGSTRSSWSIRADLAETANATVPRPRWPPCRKGYQLAKCGVRRSRPQVARISTAPCIHRRGGADIGSRLPPRLGYPTPEMGRNFHRGLAKVTGRLRISNFR